MTSTSFADQKYVCVETFKRNGQGVRTPLWFIEDSGILYVWTMSNSGKAKRIRNNPKVRVVPSTARGKPKGTWVDAKARLAESSQAERVLGEFGKKYGIVYWFLSHLGRGKRRVFEIRVS